MAKLRIEKPFEDKVNLKKGKPSFLRPFVPVLIVLLVVAVCILIASFLRRGPVNLPEFEIDNFSGNVEILSADGSWKKAERGMRLLPGGGLRTGEASEADLLIPGQLKARLKAGSELAYKKPGYFDKNRGFHLNVAKGEILLATEKGSEADSSSRASFNLEGQGIRARAQHGYFYLKSEPAGQSMLGVMRGKAEVSGTSGFGKSWRLVPSLHFASAEAGKNADEPKRMSREEWNHMREVYDLKLKSAAMEAMQLDLSKKAGSFFSFVFDHGTFYTPKFGYSGRDFFLDDSTGESYLEVEYDVFPKGSFVGVYMKTRDLDLSQFDSLQFEMRKSPDGEGEPQAIRIELKAKTGVVRAFAAKLPKEQWQPVTFPLHLKTPTQLTEITLVFLHDRVGEYKKGAVQIRRLNVTPKKAEAEETPVAVEIPLAAVEKKSEPALDLSAEAELSTENVPAASSPAAGAEKFSSPPPAGI